MIGAIKILSYKKGKAQVSAIILCFALVWFVVLLSYICHLYCNSMPVYRIDFLRSDGYLARTEYLMENGVFENSRVSPLYSISLIPVVILFNSSNTGMAIYQTLCLLCVFIFLWNISQMLYSSVKISLISLLLVACNPVVVNWYLTGQSEIFQAAMLIMYVYYSILYLYKKSNIHYILLILLLLMLILTKPTYAYIGILQIVILADNCKKRIMNLMIVIIVLMLSVIIPKYITSNEVSSGGAERVGSRALVEMIKGTIYANRMIDSLYVGTNLSKVSSAPDISETGLQEVLTIIDSNNHSRMENVIRWHINNPIMFIKKILLNTLMFSSIGDTSKKTLIIALYNIPLWILFIAHGIKSRNKTANKYITLIVIIYIIIHIIILALARYMIPVYPIVAMYAAKVIIDMTSSKQVKNSQRYALDA